MKRSFCLLGLPILLSLGVGGALAAEVPNLTLEDKQYDAASGTVEFTLVNSYGSRAVAWSLSILSAESDGTKAKLSVVEDRQDFLDSARWVSETPPERGYVPAGGRLRQRLEVQPDVGGFAAITIEVQAVVYEDVASIGDEQVLRRIFENRVARAVEKREVLDEIFGARLESRAESEWPARVLEKLERLEATPPTRADGAQVLRQGLRKASYQSVLRASLSADPAGSLQDLEARWLDEAQRIEASLRDEDRARLRVLLQQRELGGLP
jgi:hypothetical protein